ncbi:MAG: hypothetical protein IPH54_17030 [Rhodoferax sp.]|nr:hypothetical protein [Rhodoferax sp.]
MDQARIIAAFTDDIGDHGFLADALGDILNRTPLAAANASAFARIRSRSGSAKRG